MFRRLLSLDEAKKILIQSISLSPIGTEKVLLSEAFDRVLAKNVVASLNVPPFTRSTVDGFAVRASETFGADEENPTVFQNCGQVNLGEKSNIIVDVGTVAEIATGAPLPEGTDSVVMVEYTARRDDTILVYRPVSTGENVMKAGSDIRKGELILRRNQKLSPGEIGVLAAVGLNQIEVYKRPRIAVVSTGPEVMDPGKPLPKGKIYNINTYTLSAAVLECGGKPINLGTIIDDKNQLKMALRKAMDLADVVITSGGVSVGPKDIVPQVVDSLGKPGVIISGIAVKPGKPVTVALVNGKPIFSLPGHPTSSLLMFHILVRPLLCKIAGTTVDATPKVKARAATSMFPAKGRRTFVMVKLSYDKVGELITSPVPIGLSGSITTLAKADGYVVLGERTQLVKEGDEVTVHLFVRRKPFGTRAS